MEVFIFYMTTWRLWTYGSIEMNFNISKYEGVRSTQMIVARWAKNYAMEIMAWQQDKMNNNHFKPEALLDLDTSWKSRF